MTGFIPLGGVDFAQALAVLLPIDALAAEILDEDAAPAPLPPIRLRITGWRRRAGDGDWASVPLSENGLTLRSKTTPSGHLALFDAVEGEDGIVRQPYFADAGRRAKADDEATVETEIDLTVDGDVYRPTTKLVSLPAHDRVTEIELRPNYRYPFRPRLLPTGKRWPNLVRGRLVDDEGRGVAGMVVHLQTEGMEGGYETDGTGHFVLVLPRDEARSKIQIAISRPGETAPVVTPSVDVTAGEPSTPITVIKLPAGSTGD